MSGALPVGMVSVRARIAAHLCSCGAATRLCRCERRQHPDSHASPHIGCTRCDKSSSGEEWVALWKEWDGWEVEPFPEIEAEP